MEVQFLWLTQPIPSNSNSKGCKVTLDEKSKNDWMSRREMLSNHFVRAEIVYGIC